MGLVPFARDAQASLAPQAVCPDQGRDACIAASPASERSRDDCRDPEYRRHELKVTPVVEFAAIAPVCHMTFRF